MFKLLSVLILLISAACSPAARAADVAPRAQYKAPVIVVAPAWGGFYGGIVAGYGWSSDDVVGSVGTAVSADTGSITGYSIGGRLGYDFTSSPVVVGVMTDMHYSNMSAGGSTPGFQLNPGAFNGATFNADLNWWGSANLRVGFEPLSGTPLLVYGLGGIAYGNVTTDGSAAVTLSNGQVNTSTFSASNTNFGWDAGIGLGYMLAPKSEIFVEYRYVDLGSFGGSVAGIPGIPQGNHINCPPGTCFPGVAAGGNANFSTILFGYNYHF